MNINNKNNISTDLDIFYIIKLILSKKYLFILLTIIPLALGYLFVNSSKTIIGYKFSFNINFFEYKDRALCLVRDNSACLYDIYLNRLALISQAEPIDFNISKNTATIKNYDITILDSIYEKLIESNEILSSEIYHNATSYNNIYIELTSSLTKDDNIVYKSTVPHQLTYNNSLISKVERGQQVFTLSDPVIIQYPKFSIGMILFLVLFAPIFSFMVLLVIDNLKKKI